MIFFPHLCVSLLEVC